MKSHNFPVKMAKTWDSMRIPMDSPLHKIRSRAPNGMKPGAKECPDTGDAASMEGDAPGCHGMRVIDILSIYAFFRKIHKLSTFIASR